jgi:perosamine synthetase
MNSLIDHVSRAYRKVYEGSDFIPLHAPVFKGNEKLYLLDCIDSTFVSSVGKYVDQFQSALAEYCGAKYAIAVVNGTSALHLSLVVHDVHEGHEVICPDVTFVATAASVVYTGADPVFLDIDEDTLGLSAQNVEQFILENTSEVNGKRINNVTKKQVKACIPMHNIGFPVRIAELKDVCDKYNLILIEDAAEALGSSVKGKMPGTFGSVGVYSFNGNKIITSGGGGALVTNSEDIYKKALHLSTTAKVPHPFTYKHDAIGYNYRMPNINAALGLAQLETISDFLEIKRCQVESLKDALDSESIEVILSQYGISNNWFTVARLSNSNLEIGEFIRSLGNKGIMARPLWSQVSKMAPYQNYFSTDNMVSEKLLKEVVCLPNGVAQ